MFKLFGRSREFLGNFNEIEILEERLLKYSSMIRN